MAHSVTEKSLFRTRLISFTYSIIGKNYPSVLRFVLGFEASCYTSCSEIIELELLSFTILLLLGETLCVDGCVLGLSAKREDTFVDKGENWTAVSWVPTRRTELRLLVKFVAGCPLKVVCVVWGILFSDTWLSVAANTIFGLSSSKGLHLDCGETAHRLAFGFLGAVLVKHLFELFRLE